LKKLRVNLAKGRLVRLYEQEESDREAAASAAAVAAVAANLAERPQEQEEMEDQEEEDEEEWEEEEEKEKEEAQEQEEMPPLEKLRVNLAAGRGGAPAEVPLAYLAACTLDWSPDRVLGQGIFGQVFRGVDDAHGIRFVVKRINLASLATVSDDPSRLGRKMWEREVAALTRFSNPNIVKLVGFTPPTVDVKNICLVCILMCSFVSYVHRGARMHSPTNAVLGVRALCIV
jgi:hypothetical protein